ncbi:MAG: nucleotidyltransferase family protein [Ruminococcus sp.]|nr:nucleotidyltransferase family protein [Ruminococcus sp.]
MKISGIICEYNPLHNGHLHHIQTVRENGADAIVAVMSGNFMQRGDVSIMEKLTRAQLALKAGVDLVIELPVIWSLAPADQFAAGGVALLNALQVVDEISFGCECADLEMLRTAAEVCRLCQTEYVDTLRMFTRQGNSYPAVLQELVTQIAGEEVASVLTEPNNTLAVAYLNALADQNSRIQPFAVQRKGAGHNSTGAVPVSDTASDSENPAETEAKAIASASYIRHCLDEGIDCHHMMPSASWREINAAQKNGTYASMRNLERILLYKLRTMTVDEISQVAEVGASGLAGRIYQARNATSLSDLFSRLCTKRYPTARLRRIMLHMLIGITRHDMYNLPPYGRILAFNNTGRKVLANSKGIRQLPFAESLKYLSAQSRAARHVALTEARATDIYQLACNSIGTAGSDFRHKITLTNTSQS